MLTERDHWLSITDDPDWRRNHINDPSISLDETMQSICTAFPESPNRIIEIGCGFGRLTREMRQRYPDAHVTGVDINPTVLSEARSYDPGTEFICGSNLFGLLADAVYSVAVFQHLPDAEKRAYIAQSHDCLTGGGVLQVQFIEGERDNFCDHWVSGEQMLLWCHQAGFTSTQIAGGLVHPQWSWITAVK